MGVDMPTYKVTKTCFYGGVHRTPNGRHARVVTDEPLDPVPSYLKLVDDADAEPKPARRGRPPKGSAAPKPDSVQGKVAGEDVQFDG